MFWDIDSQLGGKDMERIKRGCTLLLIVCMLMACGKESTSNTEEESADQIEAVDESQDTEEKRDTLGGVYQDGDELVNVPMGTCVQGIQKEVCTVQMPENYLLYGLYMDDTYNFQDYENVYNVLVKQVAENNVWENGIPMSGCKLSSTSGDPVTGLDIYIQECSFEEVVPVQECTEVKDCEYQTLYCDSPEICMDNDVSVYIKASDNIVILVNYTGTLYTTLGAEELSKNIYDLFEISY